VHETGSASEIVRDEIGRRLISLCGVRYGRGMTGRVLATDVLSLPLTDESQPGIWVDGGWPTARTATLAELGGVSMALWEVTDGIVSDIENDECLLVLAGTGRVRFEDGEMIDLGPGVCIRLRGGERTEWTVLSAIRAFLVAER
jgi:uncharacterized cupin superfamily protein